MKMQAPSTVACIFYLPRMFHKCVLGLRSARPEIYLNFHQNRLEPVLRNPFRKSVAAIRTND